ncbi:MAG: hypothetical protein IJR19_04040, partial [Lachnospiraceae bacterium]|nr:hypothetical protein [Lachnospiraceae bacterium]
MKMTKGFRSFVAMLAMTAMLLENTAAVTVFAADTAEPVPEQSVEVTTEAVSEQSTEVTTEAVPEQGAEVTTGAETTGNEGGQAQKPEGSSGQATGDETQAAGTENQTVGEESQVSDGNGTVPNVELTVGDGEQKEERSAEPETTSSQSGTASTPVKDEGNIIPSVTVVDNGKIEVSGYNSIPLYINTDRMNAKDSFHITIEGPEGISYGEKLSGKLYKADSNIYNLENLDTKTVTARADSLSEGLDVQYSVRDDGYPMISLISAEEKEPEKLLKAIDDGRAVEGSGFTDITVSVDAKGLRNGQTFTLFMDSAADVRYNGAALNGKVEGLDPSVRSLTFSNLEYDPFTIYVVGEESNTIAAEYTIDSVDNGAVSVRVYDSGREQSVKRTYEYEDDNVYVTATLEKVDAIPDDAFFSVTQVLPESKEYDYDSYINALNDNSTDTTYDESNTLLYDIAFYTDETKTVEIEPEEGAVSVSILFKQGQLNSETDEAEGESIEVTHLKESDSNIEPEKVESEISENTGTIDFSTESFSTYAISYVSPVYKFVCEESGFKIEVTVPKEYLESKLDKKYFNNLNENHIKLYAFRQDRENGSWYNAPYSAIREYISKNGEDIYGFAVDGENAVRANLYTLSLWCQNETKDWKGDDIWDWSFRYLCSFNDIKGAEVKVTLSDDQLKEKRGAKKPSDVSVVQIRIDDEEHYSAGNGKEFSISDIKGVTLVDSNTTLDDPETVSFTLNNASDFGIVVLDVSDDSSAKDAYYNGALYSSVKKAALNNNGKATFGDKPYELNETKDAYSGSEYDEYKRDTGMGTAGDFHLVAFDSVYGMQHIYGNILAKNLRGTTAGFGSYRNELSYVQNLIDGKVTQGDNTWWQTVHTSLAGGGSNDTFAFGDGETIYYYNGNYYRLGQTAENADKSPIAIYGVENYIQDMDSADAPFIDLDRVYDEVTAYSSELRKLGQNVPASDVVFESPAMNTYVKTIDCTGVNGTAVVNIKGSTLDQFKDNNPLKVYGNPTQAILINVDCEGKDYVSTGHQIYYYIKNGNNTIQATGGEHIDQNQFGHIIWNFYNYADNARIYIRELKGQVIAPDATVEYYGGEGNVIARNIYVTNESHRMDYTAVDPINPDEQPDNDPGVKTPATVEIPVSKTFAAGDTWPEGTSYTFTLRGSETVTTTTAADAETSGDCYTTTAYIHQTPETGRGDYRIQVDAHHNGDHSNSAQWFTVTFNQPVEFKSVNGELVSGNNTDTIVFKTNYHQNPTDNIGLGDLIVTSDAGLELTGIVCSDGYGSSSAVASSSTTAETTTSETTTSETTTNESVAGSVTIGNTGTGSVGPLVFEPAEAAGTESYYYTLSENDPGYSDVIKDPRVYEIRIDVTTTIDGKDSTATAEIYYKNANGDYVKLQD